ncbi:hypothetical protein O6H91_22G012100 [Diphasiastrum complanatum]|uniref:Uncharacterized protein n=2 Tax=Diphasiastrum complanatum TaxID=34168 RepID=A0ACC2AD07_DIPCM|nr:hypothetical protein O6H91_22G012100 [Diphasiastrum complanatum]KAJ7515397.1 hypothetical protein O6H91_22G012100 [Diphasiastrum complanatum]
MYYHPKRLPANEDRIYKQRLYEDARRARLESVHEYERFMRCAEFENSYEPKMKYRSLSEQAEALKAEKEKQLEIRRRKLAALLEEESLLLEAELKTSTMNLAERRAWLEARARALKQQRQQKETNYAEEQFDRFFRQNCDDVRINNSKMAVLKAEEERKRQREENLKKSMQEAEERSALDRMMEEDWKRQEELYRQELEKQKERKMEAMDILREQLELVHSLQDEERQAVQDEMQYLARKWQEEEEDLRQHQYEQRCLAAQRHRELLEYNESSRAEKQALVQEEKELDAHLADMVREREAAEEEQEKQLKGTQRREAIAYAAHLKAAMEKQQSNDAEIENVIKAEAEEEWRRKDGEVRNQEGERQRLISRAHEERQAQLQAKERERCSQAQEKALEFDKLCAEAKDMELWQQEHETEVKMSKQDLREALEAQIRCKQAVDLAAKEKKRCEFEGTKVSGKKYEDKVKQALSLPHPEPRYGRKTAKWFF